MFEFKVTAGEGEEQQQVVLRFRPYGDAPGRIARHNINNVEAQVWQYLEWGLVEPKNWPVGSDRPGDNIFDEITQRDISKCYQAWQAADEPGDEDEVGKGESAKAASS